MNTTYTRRRLTAMMVAAMTFATAAPLWARDYYVAPQGAGAKTGADWDNAMDRHAMVNLLAETVAPGDRVMLGSGEYGLIGHKSTKTIALLRGGTAEKPISVEGIDTGDGLPRIVGRYNVSKVTYHAHSYNGISFAEGVSYVRVAHLRFAHYMNGIKTSAKNTHLLIEDVHIEQVREGFVLSGISESIFRNCSIKSYAKRGMGFESACDNLQVVDVVADCTGGAENWATEAFPFGFVIESEASNHHIRFERCVARNNLWQGEPKKYWNGDGFVAEGKAYDISYYDCAAYDNTDGGWDNKSRASVMVRCVAVGNKRNIRIWNSLGGPDQPTRLTQCLSVHPIKRGGSGGTAALWATGTIEAEMCTLDGGDDPAVELSAHEPGGHLTARNCILVSKHDPAVKQEQGTTYTPVDVATDDPQFAAPSPAWRGEPVGAYNSTRYGKTKGYYAE